VLARALHYSGNRSHGPFVAVNCSALVENLLESELFGHAKGAFTGAHKDKKGRFEVANGGTIFLDEIGDLSPMIQLKLLRVLQEKEFERVGENTPVSVDVRVIAATNCDLKEKICAKTFREDLFYRLKVMEVVIPPLRERSEDIPLLTNHFCKMFNKTYHKNIQRVSDEVLKVFINYPWPGNIRELKHAIERAFVLCSDEIIQLEYIPQDIINFFNISPPSHHRRSSLVEGHITFLNMLTKTDGNVAKAARILGISRQTMYRKMRQFKIENPKRNQLTRHTF
jgi:two-component system, NtrC family, response regulator HydG